MKQRQHSKQKKSSKSFILRSSGIKSKSTPTHTHSESQQSALTLDNNLPSIVVARENCLQFTQKQQQKQKDNELKNRLSRLTLNLKTLEKQYKQNLKQGFQNKIKSYRLHAVMQRKLMKQTIQQTLYMNEQQQITQKHETAMRQKQFNELTIQRHQQFKQRQLEMLRRKADIERRQNKYAITAREREVQGRNRSLRDRIKDEERNRDRKRNYLEYYRQEKLGREEFQAKKQCLQKIVSNSKRIKSLKQQLEVTEQRCLKLFIPLGQSEPIRSSSLFVTI